MHLLLFALLAVVPGRDARRQFIAEVRAGEHPLDNRRPQGGILAVFGPAVAVWLLVILPFGLIACSNLPVYGYSLFGGAPFFLGFSTGILMCRNGPRSAGAVLGASTAAVMLGMLSFLATGLEGGLCILMVLPLVLPVTWTGALLGTHLVLKRYDLPRDVRRRLPLAIVFVPIGLAVESGVLPEPPLHRVDTEIEIRAAPAVVWREVVAFRELPPPTERWFRAGIAYPIRATIAGAGPGAVRRCTFSTGDFVEPIEVWDEPRLLRFGVTSCPPALHELNPFHEVVAPHVSGYFMAVRGQFALAPTADGGTRLTGTTWYRHALWPQSYWRLWSDAIVGSIHERVLRHIRATCEAATSAGNGR